MALRKQEDNVNWTRKQYIVFYGELALEKVIELSHKTDIRAPNVALLRMLVRPKLTVVGSATQQIVPFGLLIVFQGIVIIKI